MHNTAYASDNEWMAWLLNSERVVKDARRAIEEMKERRILWLSGVAADEAIPVRRLPSSGRQKLASATERTHGRGR